MVQLVDLWEDTVSTQDKAELEKLLPEYMRCEKLASAMRADGAELADTREAELRSARSQDPAAQDKAARAKWYQQTREGPRAKQRE